MSKNFEEWAVLELMGHRKLAGKVTEQTIGSATFIRIDVPGQKGEVTATQFYNPSAIYCMTPTTEKLARRMSAYNKPEPVTRWELPESDDESDLDLQDEIERRNESCQ